MLFHCRIRGLPCAALLLVPMIPAAFAAPPSLEEVVVTASALRQGVLETAQPVIVLDGAALHREIGQSLGETLARQPGVTGTWFGPVASRPVIRGLGGQRVLMLEDGLGTQDVSALSEDHAVSIDPLIARSVEVIKGPGTLLHGNAAVGGVVNVVTQRMAEAPLPQALQGAVELRGNTAASEASGAGRLDLRAGHFVLHADGYRRTSDNLDIPGNALSRRLVEQLAAAGETDPVNPRGTLYGSDGDSDGGAVGGSYVGPRGFLGVAASRTSANYGAPGPESQADGSSVRIDMTQDRYDLSGGLEDPFAGITSIRLRAALGEYFHQEFEPDGEAGTTFDQDSGEARLSFEHAVSGGWRGTFGLQYRDVDFRAIGAEAFVPGNSTRNVGVFVFEERPLGPLTIELALRYEDQRIEADPQAAAPGYSDDGVSGSAGLLWKFAPQYSAALNVTRAIRHPVATELYADGVHVALGRHETGDPALGEETALTTDLTLRKHAGKVRFSLAAFYSRYGDFIHAQPTGEFLEDEGELFPMVDYVQQDASFHGVEADVTLPLLARDAMSLTLRLATDYVRGKLDRGGNLPLMPPWRFGAELGFERGAWQAGLAIFRHADQDDVAASELPTDGYTMIDADLSWHRPTGSGEIVAFVKGSNLADAEARRASSPIRDYAPLPGRSLAAGLRYEF